MHKNIPDGLPNLWQRSCKAVLFTAWIIGLILGIWVAAGAGNSFSLMMRGADPFAVSIPGLLLVTVLPFLITASAVFLSQPWLLVLLIFAKAFSVGYCAWGIMDAYGMASWLVGALLMFSDLGTLPLLMWLWLRHGDMAPKPLLGDLAVCLIVAAAMGILDVMVVSPFAATLL